MKRISIKFCLMTLLAAGLLCTSALAQEGENEYRYLSEDGVCRTESATLPVEEKDAPSLMGTEELIQLDAPTELSWGRYYSEDGSYVSAPGYISWKHPVLTQYEYDLCVYTVEGECVYRTTWYDAPDDYDDDWYAEPYHSSNDFTAGEGDYLESGDYYFTVQSIGDGTQYSDSEIARSDVWHYTKPTASCGKVTNLTLTQDTVSWTWPEDRSNIGGYDVDILFAKSASDTPQSVLEYSTHNPNRDYQNSSNPFSDSIREDLEELYLENGPGYYYVRVLLISKDITQFCNGEYTELSNAVSPNGAIVETDADLNEILDSAWETTSVEEQNEILTELKALDRDTLRTAVAADLGGTTAGILQELEDALGLSTKIKVTDDLTSMYLDAWDISLEGAALNANSVEDQMTFTVSKADENTVYPTMYQNTVQFSMSLTSESVSSGETQEIHELAIPVKVSMPIPASINPAFFVVLHKLSNGSYEEISSPELVITYEDGVPMANFMVTSFSDYAFAEKPQNTATIKVNDDVGTTIPLLFNAAEKELTVQADVPAGEAFYIAQYDENGKFLGVAQVADSGTTVSLNGDSASVFWLNTDMEPKCEEVVIPVVCGTPGTAQ